MNVVLTSSLQLHSTSLGVIKNGLSSLSTLVLGMQELLVLVSLGCLSVPPLDYEAMFLPITEYKDIIIAFDSF